MQKAIYLILVSADKKTIKQLVKFELNPSTGNIKNKILLRDKDSLPKYKNNPYTITE